MLQEGPVRARIVVDADIRALESANVTGELPGRDEELVIVGSHHDAPWASAVEDTSGLGLVLAQAAYWSRLPREERPHSMLFHLNTGHMVTQGRNRLPGDASGRFGSDCTGSAPGARCRRVR
jgi:hypothetical protein